jgi:hypothetical protein
MRFALARAGELFDSVGQLSVDFIALCFGKLGQRPIRGTKGLEFAQLLLVPVALEIIEGKAGFRDTGLIDQHWQYGELVAVLPSQDTGNLLLVDEIGGDEVLGDEQYRDGGAIEGLLDFFPPVLTLRDTVIVPVFEDTGTFQGFCEGSELLQRRGVFVAVADENFQARLLPSVRLPASGYRLSAG